MSLLSVWVLYAIVGVVLFGAAFVWAVRTRQFTDLNRARYIALRADTEEESSEERSAGFADRYTVVGLGIVFIGVLCCVVWAGWGR